MSVLTRAQDHIFIKLRTVNNIPGTKIPAVVRLEEDEDLVFDPSQWYIGVAEFRASLGSSSLVYKLADEDATPIKRIGGATTQPSRAVVYTELVEQHGRFASGRTKQQEIRTLDVPTYSLAGLLEHLNPQTPDITAFFSMGEDGRIMLEKPHDAAATTCTEVTLSQDLCDEFDLDDADIARVRASNRGVDQLIDIMTWFPDMFRTYTPLMAFASHCITSNAPRTAQTLRGLDGNGLLRATQTLTVTLPDEYFDLNGIKQDAVIESDMVPGMCALAVHHFVNRADTQAQGGFVVECRVLAEARKWRIAYNTTHNEWRLESSECEWYFPTNGAEQVLIEDPIIRLTAAIYQFFLTPSYTGKFDIQRNRYVNTVTLNDEDWVDQQNRRLPALKNASVFKDQQATARLAGRFMVRSLTGDRTDQVRHDNFRYQRNFHRMTSGRLSSARGREFVDLERVARSLDIDGAPTHEVTAQLRARQTDPTFRDTVTNQNNRGSMNRTVKMQSLENRIGVRAETKEFLFEYVEPLTHADSTDKFLSDPRVAHAVGYQNLLDFQAANPVFASEVSDELDQKTDEHVDHAAGQVPVQTVGNVTDFEPNDYVYDVRARLFERAYSVRRALPVDMDENLTRLNLFDGNNNPTHIAVSDQINSLDRIRYAEVHHDAYIRTRAALQREVIIENQLNDQISHIARYYEEIAPLFAQEFGGKIQNSVYQLWTSVFHTTTVGGVLQTTGGVEVPLTSPVGGMQPITQELLAEANAFQREYVIAAPEMRCYLNVNDVETGYVELHVLDAAVANALRQIDFGNKHVNVAIRQTGATRELKGRVLKFGKRFVVLDDTNQTHTFESTDCLLVELNGADAARLDVNDASFPTVVQQRNYSSGGSNVTMNIIEPTRDVLFKIDWSDDSIQGQLENQGIKHLRIKPEVPFRMCAGDKVKSLVPNSDSLQKYTSMGLVSTDGFLFKSTHFEGFKAPLLVEVPILNDIRVSASREFKTEGLSYSNTGDVYYTANGQYALHQLMTNIPLRTGSIRLQLSTRDGTETKDCELAFRGVFEVKLILIRK